MTTETKLTDLQLECAEKLPGLQRECRHCDGTGNYLCFECKEVYEVGDPKHKGHEGIHCGFCRGRTWIPVTSLSDAMVAATKAGILIMVWPTLQPAGDRFPYFSAVNITLPEGGMPLMADTPDHAFWSALHEALQRSE